MTIASRLQGSSSLYAAADKVPSRCQLRRDTSQANACEDFRRPGSFRACRQRAAAMELLLSKKTLSQSKKQRLTHDERNERLGDPMTHSGRLSDEHAQVQIPDHVKWRRSAARRRSPGVSARPGDNV